MTDTAILITSIVIAVATAAVALIGKHTQPRHTTWQIEVGPGPDGQLLVRIEQGGRVVTELARDREQVRAIVRDVLGARALAEYLAGRETREDGTDR